MFILGSCFYSFLITIKDRLLKDEDFIYTRSYCPSCKHSLKFYDLIPIFSFVQLKGKCRYCHEKISYSNLFHEIFGGFLAFLCFLTFPPIEALFVFLFISISYLIALIDYYSETIYTFTIKTFAFLCIIYSLYSPLPLTSILFSLFIPFLLMLCNQLNKNSFGKGDIELWICICLVLGLKNSMYAFMTSIYLATIYAIYQILLKSKSMQDTIPYGPFLLFSFNLFFLLNRV